MPRHFLWQVLRIFLLATLTGAGVIIALTADIVEPYRTLRRLYIIWMFVCLFFAMLPWVRGYQLRGRRAWIAFGFWVAAFLPGIPLRWLIESA